MVFAILGDGVSGCLGSEGAEGRTLVLRRDCRVGRRLLIRTEALRGVWLRDGRRSGRGFEDLEIEMGMRR